MAALSVSLSAQVPSSLSLADAMARALEGNATVLAARTARAIDLAAAQAAGQRPNPEVSVEAERETPHWSFGGSLPIELSGKRQRRIDVAQAALSVTEAETARVIAEVRSDVRQAYFTAVGALRRLEVAQELEGIATRARDAAQERFQSGAAPRLEALQAALVLSQAQNDVTSARGEVGAARVELNALLGYPADATPALPDVLEGPPPPDLAGASAAALSGNAELSVLARRIDEERARVELAKAMRRPDPSVSGTLTYDAQPEFTFGWRFGLAVALPIFTTGRAEVAVAEATLTRAVADRDARVAQITGAVAAASARAASAHQAVLRYQNDILPATIQVEQMAQESYQSGQTGVVALLQAVQSARETRLRALQAGLDYQLALAELERAIGAPLR
jgi:cobalt-zinc-cadmium efflux system outer membrane protein